MVTILYIYIIGILRRPYWSTHISHKAHAYFTDRIWSSDGWTCWVHTTYIIYKLNSKHNNIILKVSVLLLFAVSFGGCAGLFLGGSLLSFIELIYFLTWKAYHHWRQTSSTTVLTSKSKKKRKGRIIVDTWTIDDTQMNNNSQDARFSYHL